jgi:hypothetical protein
LAGGKIKCKAVLDSGADATIISRELCSKLHRTLPQVCPKFLPTPVTLGMPNGHEIKIKQFINIDIMLESKMGRLLVSNQCCLIWENLSENILLGNDLLTSQGINPDRASDSLIASNNFEKPDEYFSIDDFVETSPGIGPDIEKELFICFNNKVKEECANGLSSDYERRLINLFIFRKDVFRIKLGPDAPASVSSSLQSSAIL